METDTALVGAYRVVELHAVAYVVLNFALVVDPAYTECEDAVRFDHALDDFGFFKFRMFLTCHI